MSLIQTATQARAAIGTVVYWDDTYLIRPSVRHGTVNQVQGKNVMIDGDWKWLPDLKAAHLRTEEVGGVWTQAMADAARATAAP